MTSKRGPGRPRIPLEERLEKYKRVLPSGCHEWTGALSEDGYGVISLRDPGVPRRNRYVHRVAYELFVGLIPEGYTIDHVRDRGCVTRACFNVEHLEPVTIGENVRRGNTGKVNHHLKRRTHCKHGHEFTEENTRIGSRGERICLLCRRAASVEWEKRRPPRDRKAERAHVVRRERPDHP